MAFTIANLVEDATYVVRMTQADYNGDRVRKVNKLRNLHDIGGTDESNLQLFMRSYELVSNAAIPDATVSQEVAVTGQDTVANEGLNSKISDRLVLWFTRAHPLNAAKDIWASYIIIAPVNEIVESGGADAGNPIQVEGVDFGDASTPEEHLGAMILYLCSALTYEAIDGSITNGGWSYSAQYSGLVTAARDVGGNLDT